MYLQVSYSSLLGTYRCPTVPHQVLADVLQFLIRYLQMQHSSACKTRITDFHGQVGESYVPWRVADELSASEVELCAVLSEVEHDL